MSKKKFQTWPNLYTTEMQHIIVQYIKYELFACNYLKKIQMQTIIYFKMYLFVLLIFRKICWNFPLFHNKTSYKMCIDTLKMFLEKVYKDHLLILEINIQNIQRPFESNYATNTRPFLYQRVKVISLLRMWGCVISLILFDEYCFFEFFGFLFILYILYNWPVTWLVQCLAVAWVAVRTIGSHCWVHGQEGLLQLDIFTRLQFILWEDYSSYFKQILVQILSKLQFIFWVDYRYYFGQNTVIIWSRLL